MWVLLPHFHSCSCIIILYNYTFLYYYLVPPRRKLRPNEGERRCLNQQVADTRLGSRSSVSKSVLQELLFWLLAGPVLFETKTNAVKCPRAKRTGSPHETNVRQPAELNGEYWAHFKCCMECGVTCPYIKWTSFFPDESWLRISSYFRTT